MNANEYNDLQQQMVFCWFFIVDDATGYVLFVRTSLTVVPTIRTELSWNKLFYKKNNNKKNKL